MLLQAQRSYAYDQSGSFVINRLGFAESRSAEDLCEAFLDHLLDCATCLDDSLNGRDETCPEGIALQRAIQAKGDPSKGRIFAI